MSKGWLIALGLMVTGCGGAKGDKMSLPYLFNL